MGSKAELMMDTDGWIYDRKTVHALVVGFQMGCLFPIVQEKNYTRERYIDTLEGCSLP